MVQITVFGGVIAVILDYRCKQIVAGTFQKLFTDLSVITNVAFTVNQNIHVNFALFIPVPKN